MYDIVYVYVRVHTILEFLQMTCLFSRLSLYEPEAMTTLHVAIIFLVLAELKMGGSSDEFPMAHGSWLGFSWKITVYEIHESHHEHLEHILECAVPIQSICLSCLEAVTFVLI